jgi:pimeloyl-ACP methyl ester carboxylesterase
MFLLAYNTCKHIDNLKLIKLRQNLFSTTVLSCDNFSDESSKKSILFLHGILGSKKNWRTPSLTWRKLQPDFSCYTVDHRGHGLSSLKNKDKTSTINSCVEDLNHLLLSDKFLHCDSVPNILVGHSFGNMHSYYFTIIMTISNFII